MLRSQPELPALGAPGRRRRHRDRRHASARASRPLPTCRSRSTVNSRAAAGGAVRLRGPADVVGIDRHQIVRIDPRPNTSDFEPNYFPSIEFDRADFPWLFTPARANANGQLRPWLCLVVVRQQDGVQLTSTVDAPLPMLQDCGAGEAVRRAARSERLLGVGARAGRGRRRRAARRRGAERRAAAVAVAAGVPATADGRTPTTSPAWCRRSSSVARPGSACRSPTPS